MKLGAIEAGGTKFVCAVGDEHGKIEERISFPTTTPVETMEQVVKFFEKFTLDAIGVGTFGPADLDKASKTYGYITMTPKVKWQNFNMLGELKKYFSVPMGFDTDVNAAALGESIWGAAKDVDSCIYITVGTGIGVGAAIKGELVHGLTHPEMGHIFVRKHEDDSFAGICPYHKDCLEGLAAGPAIAARWGKPGHELQDRKEVWEIEAYYLAEAIVNYILILSPKKVVIGGGVMKQNQLYPLIRKYVQTRLNGYVHHPAILEKIDEYIVAPGLGDNAGITGAIALALQAKNSDQKQMVEN
ncbi:ROK family protein [Bacillaceae bacterium Marseille-Q3522]|nr:ROK family protein [Bacillaceae bacterium Marseille-Q3522]